MRIKYLKIIALEKVLDQTNSKKMVNNLKIKVITVKRKILHRWVIILTEVSMVSSTEMEMTAIQTNNQTEIKYKISSYQNGILIMRNNIFTIHLKLDRLLMEGQWIWRIYKLFWILISFWRTFGQLMMKNLNKKF